ISILNFSTAQTQRFLLLVPARRWMPHLVTSDRHFLRSRLIVVLEHAGPFAWPTNSTRRHLPHDPLPPFPRLASPVAKIAILGLAWALSSACSTSSRGLSSRPTDCCHSPSSRC